MRKEVMHSGQDLVILSTYPLIGLPVFQSSKSLSLRYYLHDLNTRPQLIS
jgi:hypothetical protein